jgi:hypothetical protein
MPDLKKCILRDYFYDIWNDVGVQCSILTVRRMERIAWVERGSTDGILEVEYGSYN